jgi:hypothetical protein
MTECMGQEMATDKPQVTVYIPKELYPALVEEAEREERALSPMIAILVREALAERQRKRQQASE